MTVSTAIARGAWVAFLMTATAGALCAQVPASPDRPFPELTVTDGGRGWFVIKSLDLRVEIVGFIARTTLTLEVESPAANAEAVLSLPLPPRSTVSGFWLDVGGELVEASAVERGRASIAYEEEVRPLRPPIDPGLVEWIDSQRVRIRVFPCQPAVARTLRIELVSDLGGAATPRYCLPVSYRLIERARFLVQTHGCGMPAVAGTAVPGLAFAAEGDGYLARAEIAGLASPNALAIDFPDAPARVAIVEKPPAPDVHEHVFYVSERAPQAPLRPARKIATLGILWDASFSNSVLDDSRVVDVLRALLLRLGTVRVELIPFAEHALPRERFEIRKGDGAALLARLTALVPDGATRLDRLPLDQAGVDAWVLVSDGADTGVDLPDWSARALAAWSASAAPVYAVASTQDPRCNGELLRELAHRSGGELLDLSALSSEEASARIGRSTAVRLRKVEHGPAAFDQIHAPIGTPIENRVAVTGRLLRNEGVLALCYDDGSRSEHVVRRDDARAAGPVAVRWAAIRVDALGWRGGPDRVQAAERAIGHRLVTRHSSLLVLETLDQHLRHLIPPAPSRIALHTAYVRARHGTPLSPAERRAQDDARRKEYQATLLEQWKARVAWSRRSFVLPAGYVYKAPPKPERAPPAGPGTPGSEQRYAVDKVFRGDEVEAADDPSLANVLIEAWKDHAPYVEDLRIAKTSDQVYAAYLKHRPGHGTSPAFFLEAADQLARVRDRARAIRLLGSLHDLALGEVLLLRTLARRLVALEAHDEAIECFELARVLSPQAPQATRDLALAIAERGRAREAKRPVDACADYERAIDMLAVVALGDWDTRYAGIELVALEELGYFVARRSALPEARERPWKIPVAPEWVAILTAELRVVLTWDSDRADFDLGVVEPTGEPCFYNHPQTKMGGLLSGDITRGYGPEVYLLRRAVAGAYLVQCKLYAPIPRRLVGPTWIQAQISTRWGFPDERRQTFGVRLGSTAAKIELGVVEIQDAPGR